MPMPMRLDVLSEWRPYFNSAISEVQGDKTISGAGVMHCSTCVDERRMGFRVLLKPSTDILKQGTPHSFPEWGVTDRSLCPTLMQFACVQCQSSFTALIYSGPQGPALAVFACGLGGLATPHTPAQIAFYLDQAYKAQSAGALSAAVAMYRAALEQMLFEQGFENGMLANKIQQLETVIRTGNGPVWGSRLDPRFLKVLKNLGNAAVHPNQGDISKQAAIDATLLTAIKATFVELLDLAYEEAHRRAERLKALEDASSLFEGS